MKKFIYYILSPFLLYAFSSCSKSLDEVNASFPQLAPSKIDLNAGSWKPILLSAADEFPLAAPVATSSPGYVAELNEIKAWQHKLTEREEAIINYWSVGGVLRWNELHKIHRQKSWLPVPYFVRQQCNLLLQQGKDHVAF